MLLFPSAAVRQAAVEQMANKHYDVVIVGSGVSGAILAEELRKASKTVLVLEAGPGEDITTQGYSETLNRFYEAAEKDNQSPFAENPNARMPRGSELKGAKPGQPWTEDHYFVQPGPYITDTTYTRTLAGTTMHWEAKTPRMLPEDFKIQTEFGVGRDWPVSYDEIEPYYRKAECELGVSANVEEQNYLGLHFPEDYVFPMRGLPLSYLDQQVDKGIRGTKVDIRGSEVELRVRPYPQARNSEPNPKYDGGKGYTPIGAVSTEQVEMGERCQGNNNCVPLCPVQAKYHAGKTLAKALAGGTVDLVAQCVVSKVVVGEDDRVNCLEVKRYFSKTDSRHETFQVTADVYVIAAGAIETARLLLASAWDEVAPGKFEKGRNVANKSDLVGRHLMDHAYLLSWALMPEVCGTYRGSICTGGIVDLRTGPFRREQAAFSVDIHNDGWGWATGGAATALRNLVDDGHLFGAELRRRLAKHCSSELLVAFMIEMLPEPCNRVTVDPTYRDTLGNMRPIVNMNIPDYSLEGAKYARHFAKTVFARCGAEDHSAYDPQDFGYVEHEGEGYVIRGGNHLAGTHIMGGPNDSVVNSHQRSWDHENLYLVGCGSMPTIGTANVTLTSAALTYRTAEAILADLNAR